MYNKSKTPFVLIFLLLLIQLELISQNNPFSLIESDSIVVYEYNGTGGILIEDAINSKPEIIIQSKSMASEVIRQFELGITDSMAYGQSTASCFDPHLGLIYWIGGKIQASINICLTCNYLKSSLVIPATEYHQISISADYAYAAKGFHKKTRKLIFDFCENIGFNRFLEPLESIYD